MLSIPQSSSITGTSPSGLTPLQRCSRCILQPQPTGQKRKKSNPEKEVVPFPTPWCSSYCKGSHWVALHNSRPTYLLIYYIHIFFFFSESQDFRCCCIDSPKLSYFLMMKNSISDLNVRGTNSSVIGVNYWTIDTKDLFIETKACVESGSLCGWADDRNMVHQCDIDSSKIYIHKNIGLVGRVFGNGPGDLCSIPGRVTPKTLKMVPDTSLLNTQQYKVRIEGKVEQSKERGSTLPYTSV